MRGVRYVPRSKWILAVLAFAMFAAGYLSLVNQVTIEVDGSRLVLRTLPASVGTVLSRAGVVIGEHDRVSPSLESPVHDGDKIVVDRAFPLAVLVDGNIEKVYILGGSVADALKTAGITVDGDDQVVPALDATVKPGDEIRIVRIETKRVVETVTIPFNTKRWAEPKWEKGKTGILREGVPGKKELVYELKYEDGVLVSKEKVSEKVVKSPRDKIIGIGTKILVHTLDTPAGPIRYRDVKKMVATAYYPGPESTGQWADGLTATGVVARHGVVAVDPKVIPLGTKVYIPGYGVALAADVGGAIKGNRIDLCYDTFREAVHFGRKTVDVYILEP